MYARHGRTRCAERASLIFCSTVPPAGWQEDTLRGALILSKENTEAFSSSDIRLLEAYAMLAGLGLQAAHISSLARVHANRAKVGRARSSTM